MIHEEVQMDMTQQRSMLHWMSRIFPSLCLQFSAFLNSSLTCFSLSVCRGFDQKYGIHHIDSHQKFTSAVGRLKPGAPRGIKYPRIISGMFNDQAFELRRAHVWRRLTLKTVTSLCVLADRLDEGFFFFLGLLWIVFYLILFSIVPLRHKSPSLHFEVTWRWKIIIPQEYICDYFTVKIFTVVWRCVCLLFLSVFIRKDDRDQCGRCC